MKRQFLPLTILYLSCAAPPQPASPVVVDLQTPAYSYSQNQKSEEPVQEGELSLEKKIAKVVKYVKKLPSGNMGVRNGSGHFSYSYGASKECVHNPNNHDENRQKYNEMITFAYSRITLSDVTLFDASPLLGSVDGIALTTYQTISESGRRDYYRTSGPAQKFYEAMLESMYQELEMHFNKGRHWKSFSSELEFDDPEKKVEKAYEEFMADLKLRDLALEGEVEFVAPCEK